jgi:uncharacterized protein YeaO (DUF488 family)
MTLHLSTYSWGERRRAGEGLRISCTRYLPRGVKKADYATRDYLDVWLPILAPSRELVALARAEGVNDPAVWRRFVQRYRGEMKETDARQTIQMLAALAARTPISIGCSCAAMPCHRFELEKLIQSAADDRS